MPELTRILTTSLRLLPPPIALAMVWGSEAGLFIVVAIVFLFQLEKRESVAEVSEKEGKKG
jgi:hypothetical protein